MEQCLSPTHPAVAAYFARLERRPSFRRVVAEARPFFPLFPFRERIAIRFQSG